MEDARPLPVADVTGRIALYSFTLFLAAAGLTAVTSFLWLTPMRSMPAFETIHAVHIVLTFLSGAVFFVDLMLFHRFLVPAKDVGHRSLEGARVHVGLTAWNDEEAIAAAVADFKASRLAHRVVVVDNGSTDQTVASAWSAGADDVVIEPRRGYGACCMRALAHAADGADIVVLCEGDMTFSAGDLAKMLAYLENCDLVLGTRATQELREPGTQMDWLMNPANQVVAKLVQVRFWGTRLTDVGCTYRAMRVPAYRQLAPRLWVTGNHFSPHMFVEALKLRLRVIEIPVVFRRRVGVSKGVGANKAKAARVALAMLRRIYTA